MTHAYARPSRQHGKRNPRVTVRRAVRAGLHAYLALLVLVAFLATPAVAGHLDFGHEHSETTPWHAHDLDTVLPSALAIPTVTIRSNASPYRLPFLLGSTRLASLRPAAANGIRAPPHF